MNVILISSDQHRWDALGCNGNAQIISPNLDQLAQQGTNFSHVYCNSPLCCPSRASSVTGLYASEVGVYGNGTPFDGCVKTYAHYLNENGVFAADIGRMDFAPGCDHGFDAIFEGPRSTPDVLEFMRDPIAKRVGDYRTHVWRTEIYENDRVSGHVDEICDWLESHASDTTPWMLSANFFLPHPPFFVPRKYFELYDPNEIEIPNISSEYLANQHPALKQHRYHWDVENIHFPEIDLRYKRTIYYAMVTWLDAMLGSIFDKINSLCLGENTLVIYTSDHGENLGDHGLWSKGCFYDTASRVPFIMKGPGIPAGTVIDTPVSLIDLAPTITEAVGLEIPGHYRGHSLLPLAQNHHSNHPGIVIGEYHGHDATTGEFMIFDGRYKYIHYVGMPPQLFDLKDDPGEQNDLGIPLEHEKVRMKLEEQLRETMDMEKIDRYVKDDQADKLTKWIESTDDEARGWQLLEYLGQKQYQELKPIYKF